MNSTTTAEQHLDPSLMLFPAAGFLIGLLLVGSSGPASGACSKQGWVILGAGIAVMLVGMGLCWWLATADPSGVHAAR